MRRALLATTLLFAAGGAHAQTVQSASLAGMNYYLLPASGGCSAATPCSIITYLGYQNETADNAKGDLTAYFGTQNGFAQANPHTIVIAPVENGPQDEVTNWGGYNTVVTPEGTQVVSIIKSVQAQMGNTVNASNSWVTGGSLGGTGTEDLVARCGPKGVDASCKGTFTGGLAFAAALWTDSDPAVVNALCGVPLTAVHGTADTNQAYSWDSNLATSVNKNPACGNSFNLVTAQGALHGVWGNQWGYPAGVGASAPLGWLTSQIATVAQAAPMASSAVQPVATSTAASTATPVTTPASTSSATSTQDTVTLKPGGGVATVDGHVWEITPDGLVTEDGAVVYASRGTSDMAFVQNADGTWTVWGKDDGNGPIPGAWFTISSTPGAQWVVSATPPGPSVSPAPQSAAATIPPTAVQSCATPTVAAGGFHVSGGQIIGPNGVFVARGINIYGNPDAMNAGRLATQTFKGLNFVRYIVRDPLNDPSTYKPFADLMTPQGIVVEFEHHPDGGGGQDAPFTGSKLSAESAWYASMATAFKDNPYVWFGTFNEPGVGSAGQLSAWHKATYDAIRGTGSQALLMIEPGGSRPWNLVDALVPGVYAQMTGIIMDPHVYPYQNNYSSDPTSITDNVNGMVAAAQKITSADGVIPVIIGESGPSTTGSNLDPNGYATVAGLIGVAQTGKMGGLAQFTWYPGFQSPNNLTDAAGNPTNPYGQMAQLYIGTDVVPPSACQAAATAQTTLNTITAQVMAQPATADDPPPQSAPPAATDPAVQAQIDSATAAIAQANAILAKLQAGQ